jgi:hypothetical protein
MERARLLGDAHSTRFNDTGFDTILNRDQGFSTFTRLGANTGVPPRRLRSNPSNLIRVIPAKGGCK